MIKEFFKQFKSYAKFLDKRVHYICDCSFIVKFDNYGREGNKYRNTFNDITQIDIIKEINDCYYDEEIWINKAIERFPYKTDFYDTYIEMPDNRMDDIFIHFHFYNDEGKKIDFSIQAFWSLINEDCDYFMMQLYRIKKKKVDDEIIRYPVLMGAHALLEYADEDEVNETLFWFLEKMLKKANTKLLREEKKVDSKS